MTNENIAYGLAAYTCPRFGRFSAGGYQAGKAATGPDGVNYGALLSLDRTWIEVSERLWTGVDYIGGKNINSSVNFGISWMFSKNAFLLLGYNHYTERELAGSDTVTTRASFVF